MIQTLKCPSCAAPVEHDEASQRQTIRCPFCNNTMFVPDLLRQDGNPRPIAFSFDVTPRASRQVSRWGFFVIACIVAVVLIPIGLAAYFLSATRTATEPVRRLAEVRPEPSRPQTRPSPAASGFATLALKFGGEGTGPGLFKDARSIAVDEAGHIYVGEYTGGRIQVFDSEGKFITQWMIDTEMPLRGLAANRQGTVYVVQSGKITRYEGTSGRQLGALSYADGADFDDVMATADGGLITAWTNAAHDDIVVFDASGRAVKTFRSAISGQSRRSELQMRVSADGLNNIYALGTFNNAVFKFSPDGRFVTRFGSDGDQPGQFRAPSAITVDNQGRVYVSDIKGVQVFDPEGRYLDVFKPEGIASGMDFNDRNELFIAARTKILKYVIKNP